MHNKIEEIIKRFNNELEKTSIEDFYIIRFDRSGKLILAGSIDFCYYHDVEIIFHEVSFICCPASTFTVNRLRIANEFENQKLNQIMCGNQEEGFYIAMDDTFSNISYYLVAQEIEYKFQEIKYFDKDKVIGNC